MVKAITGRVPLSTSIHSQGAWRHRSKRHEKVRVEEAVVTNRPLVRTNGIKYEEITTKRASSTRYQYIAYMSNDRPVTVERRRRETINEGINELAKIVPGCEKNKGSILQRAVEYITQLRANEARNIEKFTREKMLMDGVVQELSTSVDSLKAELDRANREAAVWKKIAVDAGLESKGDDGTADAEAEGDTDT